MKILLIYPYFLNTRIYTAEDVQAVPLGVYYVAAVLIENGYEVEILNWHDIDAAPHKIVEALEEKRPDLIGFSVVTNQWSITEKLAAWLYNESPCKDYVIANDRWGKCRGIHGDVYESALQELPEGISFDSYTTPQQWITFGPKGNTVDGGSIVLKNSHDSTKRVRVFSGTGNITID